MMAMYMAQKILEGKQDYVSVFSVNPYKKYQDDVDAIFNRRGRTRTDCQVKSAVTQSNHIVK